MSFIEAVQKYCSILHEWTQDPETADFLETMWPDLESLEEMHQRFITITVARIRHHHPTLEDAEETFAFCLARTAAELWSDKFRRSRQVGSSYLDSVVRRVVATPPGIGIGYLSLQLASTAPITDMMLDEIDISRKFTPELPLRSEEYRELLRTVGSETRLRLALIVVNAWGRCCDKLKVELSETNFRQDFQRLIQQFIAPPDLAAVDLIRQDLRLIIDLLLLSKKTR